ncbi:MAG: EcsC family protein, partial [Bacteroidetes bacterium]|nr:EcsC family protein [Bacteroidota bacterium]
MRLTDYERTVQKQIETWQSGDVSLIAQVLNWAMAPMDWVV